MGERDLTRDRAVTYHRVSTRDQDPTLARAELRRAAALRGLEIIEEVEETGSGARMARPGLDRVMELVNHHLVTHVLVWKLDRFGRSLLDIVWQIESIERAGVTFISVTQGIEIGWGVAGAMGKLVLHIMAAMAEFERTLGIERTQLGMGAARARGVKFGRPKGAKDRKKRKRRETRR